MSNNPVDIKAEIRGLAEVQAKMQQVSNDMGNGEMVDAFRAAANLVSRDAKLLAPVFEGRLRSSITPDVRMEGKSIVGVVGSNVFYAPYQELGTGTPAGNSPHYPPPSALDVWAKRKGFASGFVVARAIWERGGLLPKRFLQRAFEQNQSRIIALVEAARDRMVKK